MPLQNIKLKDVYARKLRDFEEDKKKQGLKDSAARSDLLKSRIEEGAAGLEQTQREMGLIDNGNESPLRPGISQQAVDKVRRDKLSAMLAGGGQVATKAVAKKGAETAAKKGAEAAATSGMSAGTSAGIGIAGQLAGDALTEGNEKSTSANVAGGAIKGAATGAAFGPVGVGVGAAVGGAMGALKARSARKQAKRQAEAKKFAAIAEIEKNKGKQQQQAFQSIMAGLRSAFIR